ncbi:MAG: hypothetical protein ACFCUU_07210 [Cyclobacteriaceae bacterium]
MNKLRLFFTLFLTICLSQQITAQLTKNDSIVMIADSLVISMTSQEYFEVLEREDVPYKQEWTKMSSMTDLTKINSSNYKKENTFATYSIHYKLKNSVNDKNLLVINEIGGMGPAGVFIELDEQYELVNPRRFTIESKAKYEYKAYQRYLNSNFITKEKARLVAEEYFSKGMKEKYWAVQFIYDTRSDIFYWCVRKEKGFKKVAEESVYINAENAEYIDKKTHNYSQSFWMALFGI